MEKCIIFSRVSTEKQSLASQTQALQEEAVKYLYPIENQIVIEEKESGISLKESERIGIDKLKRTIEQDPEVSCVFTWEISRVSRKPAQIYSVRDFLIEHKVRWINITPAVEIIDKSFQTPQFASLILGVYSSFAESEMMIKKERAARGVKRVRETGGIFGGRPLKGYVSNRKTKRYDIDPADSSFIRRVFKMYSTGQYSYRLLAKELKSEGYFPNTDLHSIPAILSGWLNDDRYIGTSPAYKALISKELFDKCKEVTESHNYIVKTGNTGKMLCKGLIFSKLNGHSLIPYATKHQYVTHPDYKPGISIMQHIIDPVIEDFTQEMINKFYRNKDEITKDLMTAETTFLKKLSSLETERLKLLEKLDRVSESYIEGKITKDKSDQMTMKYKSQLSENEILNVKLREEYGNKVEFLNSLAPVNFSKLTFQDKRKYVLDVISKIEIEKEKALKRLTTIYIHCKLDNKIYKLVIDSNSRAYKYL